MATERTLSIIKPDATRRNLTGKINACFEDAGLRIVAQKRLQLTQAQAEAFYGVHRERGFFKDLVAFMISGPVVAQVLEGEGAVLKNRDIMGATDPAKAADGHHPQAVRRKHRGEFGAWLGQRRERGGRNRVLLRRHRNRRMSSIIALIGRALMSAIFIESRPEQADRTPPAPSATWAMSGCRCRWLPTSCPYASSSAAVLHPAGLSDTHRGGGAGGVTASRPRWSRITIPMIRCR